MSLDHTDAGLEKLFFIRVGGSAMGSVAAAVQRNGSTVIGSEEDLYEPMKSYLAESGVQVLPRFDPSNIDENMPDAVVVGNAVSRGNVELERALNLRLPLLSLPQIIAERLIDRNRCAVVAGTHGKTTTTAILAEMLEHAGRRPGWLVGGVLGNGMESCRPVPQDLHNTEEGIFVVEGDEYDSAYFDKRSKFLWYRPTVAIVNNIELDHTDIFESLKDIKKSFRLFIRLAPQNGVVLARAEDPSIDEILQDACSPVERFGWRDADWVAQNCEYGEDETSVELAYKGVPVARITMAAPGDHNVMNMVAAAAAAHHLGLSWPEIEAGAAAFSLPKRRMQEIGWWRGALVIDDFAHHPTAIAKTLAAIAQKHPGKRIWAVFEPRSNSTTRCIFQKEIGESLSLAAGAAFGALDRPWRYPLEQRLDTALLASQMKEEGRSAIAVSEEEGKDKKWGRLVKEWLCGVVQPGDVITLMSNGDIGGLRSMLLEDQDSLGS